jgi:RHS repeat-associated protein
VRALNQQPDIVYSYTKTGQVQQMAYPPVNAYVEYAYNHRKWLDSIVAHTGSVPTTGNLLFKQVLAYDPSGQVTQQRYQHGTAPEQKQEYAYDSLDRLTKWTQNNGADATSYTYDAVGNRTKMTESFVPSPDNYGITTGKNQLTSRSRHNALYGDTITNYRYDANGAMVYRELTIDSSQGSWPGRTPKPSKIGLRFKEEDRYSYRGLLNRVFRTDSNNVASDWRYRYSPSGEREQKRMVYTSAWDSVMPYPWVYYLLGGGNAQLAVYHGQQTSGTGMCGDSGRRVYIYPTEYLTYGVGPGMNVVTGPTGAKSYRIADHIGSTRTMIGAGGATATDYEPYGRPLGAGAVTGERKGFIDKENDRETANDNAGVRSLDPRPGRFTSIDPLAEKFPGQSPYVYSYNNPLRFIDNDGRAGKPGQKDWVVLPNSEFDFGGGGGSPLNPIGRKPPEDWERTLGGSYGPAQGGRDFGRGGGRGDAIMEQPKPPIKGWVLINGERIYVVLNSDRYGEACAHIEDAQRAGHPSDLTKGYGKTQTSKPNRAASLRGTQPVPGKDRDEYPPAMTLQGGAGASIRPITPSDNQGAGSTLGWLLRPFPAGTVFTLMTSNQVLQMSPQQQGALNVTSDQLNQMRGK